VTILGWTGWTRGGTSTCCGRPRGSGANRATGCWRRSLGGAGEPCQHGIPQRELPDGQEAAHDNPRAVPARAGIAAVSKTICAAGQAMARDEALAYALEEAVGD
jgi:hypothetical protein